MAGPSPDLTPIVEQLPPWLQGVITVAIGIGTVIGGAIVYIRRLTTKTEPEPEKTKDLVITAAGLTDTTAFKELATAIGDANVQAREQRRLLERIVVLLEEEKEEREQDREVEQRVEAELIRRAMSMGRPSG